MNIHHVRVTLALIALFVALCPAYAQVVVPLDTELPLLELKQVTLFQAVQQISSGPAQFTVGFESVLRPNFSDPPIPEPRFSLRLEKTTLRRILDQICALDGRYAWSATGSTLNFYPKRTEGDDTYLMNRRFERLELRKVTSVQEVLLAVYEQLPPPREQVAQVQMGGDSTLPAELWTQSFDHVTLRQVLNAVVERMGKRSWWVLSGSRDFRGFAFYRK